MKFFVRFLTLSAVLCAASAPAKQFPTGIYNLFVTDSAANRLGDLTNRSCWTNPYIDGVRLRTGWDVVQPQESSFDWGTIDQALSLAAQHGKRVGISVSAGITTPQWVYDKGAAKYTLTDGSGNSMPIPWDAAFQTQWISFIKTMAARYDGNPALAYVCATGFMQLNVMYLAVNASDDTNLNALAVQAGYVDIADAFIPAAEKIMGAFLGAFPTTPVILTPTLPFITRAMFAQDSVRDWGKANYPGRYGELYASLRAVKPPHAAPLAPLTFPKGFQMICTATDPNRLYNYLQPPYTPPAPTPLLDALENAYTLQGQFVEVYPVDLDDPANQSILNGEREKLKANLPMQPPLDLHTLGK